MSAGFEAWFARFREQVHGWEADQQRAWLEAAWNAAAPPRMYGLTADEWLHLAAEGQDSEVAPCCGNISELREYLNALATCQGEGESGIMLRAVLESYEAAASDHEAITDAEAFPLLHRVLAGVRAQQAADEEFARAYQARIVASQKARQEDQS